MKRVCIPNFPPVASVVRVQICWWQIKSMNWLLLICAVELHCVQKLLKTNHCCIQHVTCFFYSQIFSLGRNMSPIVVVWLTEVLPTVFKQQWRSVALKNKLRSGFTKITASWHSSLCVLVFYVICWKWENYSFLSFNTQQDLRTNKTIFPFLKTGQCFIF